MLLFMSIMTPIVGLYLMGLGYDAGYRSGVINTNLKKKRKK